MTLVQRMQKAKHWQIFLLIFGLPFLFQIVSSVFMVSSLIAGQEPDPGAFVGGAMVFGLVFAVLIGAVFLLWFWSMSVGLKSFLPVGVNLKFGWFKFFLFYPVVYMFIFMIFMQQFMGFTDPGYMSEEESIQMLKVFGLIVPFHLFAFVCMLLAIRFVAKTIGSIELKRVAHFSDYVGDFFLLLFYPIGVWFVQPKVNQIVGGGTASQHMGDEQILDS